MDIKRGAEAVVKITEHRVIKERIPKRYRQKELDQELRTSRTKREAKLLVLAKRAGVPTPLVKDVDLHKKILEVSTVIGDKIKDILNDLPMDEREHVCRTIGNQIGLLHARHIIHGDLTTSNMILEGERVFFIDFGLGEINESIETKGVDLLVFKKALYSAHWMIAEECFSHAVEGYQNSNPNADKVLKRLHSIERRGRYIKER